MSKATTKPASAENPIHDYIQADEDDDLAETKLLSLKKKFRVKRDLYAYMDTRGKHQLKFANTDTISEM